MLFYMKVTGKEKGSNLKSASSSKSFRLVIPISKTLFRDSTPSIWKASSLLVKSMESQSVFKESLHKQITVAGKIILFSRLFITHWELFTNLCKKLVHDAIMDSSTISSWSSWLHKQNKTCINVFCYHFK